MDTQGTFCSSESGKFHRDVQRLFRHTKPLNIYGCLHFLLPNKSSTDLWILASCFCFVLLRKVKAMQFDTMKLLIEVDQLGGFLVKLGKNFQN